MTREEVDVGVALACCSPREEELPHDVHRYASSAVGARRGVHEVRHGVSSAVCGDDEVGILDVAQGLVTCQAAAGAAAVQFKASSSAAVRSATVCGSSVMMNFGQS